VLSSLYNTMGENMEGVVLQLMHLPVFRTIGISNSHKRGKKPQNSNNCFATHDPCLSM
jgi:hypothetical protein